MKKLLLVCLFLCACYVNVPQDVKVHSDPVQVTLDVTLDGTLDSFIAQCYTECTGALTCIESCLEAGMSKLNSAKGIP